MSERWHVAAVALTVAIGPGAACRDVREERALARSEHIVLRGSVDRGAHRLRLDAAPGARINARLPPVLEMTSGERVTFASDARTSDSSYFTQSPQATLRHPRSRHGTLWASVCPASILACLSVVVDVVLP